MDWVKSSLCDSSACVEVAQVEDERYLRDAQGTVMTLDVDTLRDLLADVRAGALDQYMQGAGK